MPHFYFETGDDGSIIQVIKDGKPHDEGVVLEMPSSIVSIYFKLAFEHLDRAEASTAKDIRRQHGLQSFLMSLTGLEAFANTFFHVHARAQGNDIVLKRLTQKHGSLSQKIRDLLMMSGYPRLPEDEDLEQRVFDLSEIRNEIVHPRWEPSSLIIDGDVQIIFRDLVENRHSLFEDSQFCREALFWCLLVVVRIGQAAGEEGGPGFIFHWTARYQLTLEGILNELDISAASKLP